MEPQKIYFCKTSIKRSIIMSNYYKLVSVKDDEIYLIKDFSECNTLYYGQISIGFCKGKTYFWPTIVNFDKKHFTAYKATKEEEYWIEECIKQQKALTKYEFYESLKGRKFKFVKTHCFLSEKDGEFTVVNLKFEHVAGNYRGCFRNDWSINLDDFFDDIRWVTEEKQKVSSVKQEYQEKVRGYQCVKHTNQQQLFFIKTFLKMFLNDEIKWYNDIIDFPSNFIIRFKSDECLDLAYGKETSYVLLKTSRIWSFEEFVEIFDEEIKKYNLQEKLNKILHPESLPIIKNELNFISEALGLEESEKSVKNKDIFIRPVIKTKEKMDLTLENFTLKFVNIPISQKPIKKVPSIKVEIFKLNY